MEKLELKIENAGNEIILREGKAVDPLPLKEPKIINIGGDIHSVSAFLKERIGEREGAGSQFVEDCKAIVEVDKNARTIKLSLDPENHYGATITAALEPSDELKPFYINLEKKFDRKQLQHLIKFSRLYFNDREEHAKLLTSLSKLRIKTETELRQENDNRGNRGHAFEQKVIDDNGFAQFFTLFIPIFKGFEPIKIQVEICFEPSENGILFWLESPELNEITESKINDIFNGELENCKQFVIINK